MNAQLLQCCTVGDKSSRCSSSSLHSSKVSADKAVINTFKIACSVSHAYECMSRSHELSQKLYSWAPGMNIC